MGFFLDFVQEIYEQIKHQLPIFVQGGRTSKQIMNEWTIVDFQARQDDGFRFPREEAWKSCGSWNWCDFKTEIYGPGEAPMGFENMELLWAP